MLWYPLSVKRAALLWTVSIFCSYFYWWGFHAEAQHSRLDFTIATYAFVFVSVDADRSLNLIYFPIVFFYIYKHIQFNTITCKQKDGATSSKAYLRLSPMTSPRWLPVESGWRKRTQSICACYPEFRSVEFSWGGDGRELDRRPSKNLIYSCPFGYLCLPMKRVHEWECDMCFTVPPGPKPMLVISENGMCVKRFKSMADDTML